MSFWRHALQKLTLRQKLVMGFGYLLFILLLVDLHGIETQRRLSEQTQMLVDQELMGLSHLKEANLNLIRVGRSLRQMMLAPDEAGRMLAKDDLLKARDALEVELAEGKKRLSRDDNKLALQTFEQGWETYRNNIDKAISLIEKQGYPKGEAQALLASEEFSQVFDGADTALSSVARGKEMEGREVGDQAREIFESSRHWNIVWAVLGLLGLPFGYMVGTSIRRPAEDLRHVVESLAAGELDVSVPYTSYPNEVGAMARSIEPVIRSA